jgi:hypothetical protein
MRNESRKDTDARAAGTMTPRGRIEAAFRHGAPDRTPVFEYVLLSPIADRVLGRPYADYAGGVGDAERWSLEARERGWRKALESYVRDRLDLAAALGHDMLYVCPSPLPEREAAAARSGAAAPVEDGPDDPVERVRLAVARGEGESPGLREENLLVYRLLNDEMRARGIDLPVMAPAYAHGIWTNVDLMQTMLLAPEVARSHFALATRRALSWIESYLSLGITLIGVGGDFAGNRPLISPELYRQFIVPEVRTCARRIHGGGALAVNASDGDLWSVIDDFLLGCEVDGYLEIEMRAGMDLARLRERFGGRVTFLGNMDCGSVLSFSPVDEVRRATRECLEAGRGGGHVFCASNAITASVRWENYVAMVNEYRAMFGVPAFGG